MHTNLEDKILKLKKELNAVILSHYYQEDEIQDIADFVGDSLALSKEACKTKAEVIVFCGVRFMAEAASILNPNKLVLLPDMKAGCSLEDSCNPESFKLFCSKHPDHKVVTYINSSAQVKALSDVIVTSSNAEKIIQSIEGPIIFAPDKHLGKYLIKKTGKNMTLWNGSCIVHENFSQKGLIDLIVRNPKAKVIAHPECEEHMLEYAQHIGSTLSLVNYVSKFQDSEFIVLTEPGIIHQMKKVAPSNIYHEAPGISQLGCTGCSQCPYMRMNTMEKLFECMENKSPSIDLDHVVKLEAKKSLDEMIRISNLR